MTPRKQNTLRVIRGSTVQVDCSAQFSVSGIAVGDYLSQAETSSMVRIATAGSVDDGKSTFIGRLLHDTKNVYGDTLRAAGNSAKALGDESLSLAMLTDGLKAERAQGITIDVAYRYFSTPKRRFILADTPGHEQYTRNMATGASTADVAIILIDARKGVLIQTKRHAFIAALLGVPRLLVAINKMDLVDYSKEVFDRIVADFSEFAAKLGVKELRFVPVSALAGDNMVSASTEMPWYHGETVMEYLENVFIAGDMNHVDFRYPIQYVIRPNQNFRGYAGQVRSGHIRVGEEVLALPSMRRSRVKSIERFARPGQSAQIEQANAATSICLTLEDEIDLARGDMLVRPNNAPEVKTNFDAMLIWFSESNMDLAKTYILLHAARKSRAILQSVNYQIDVTSLARSTGTPLKVNEIGRVKISSSAPLFLDPYQRNRATGNFILIDEETGSTVAAGMVLDRHGSEQQAKASPNTNLTRTLHKEPELVTAQERQSKADFKAVTIWCTGLSGSGKSTIARNLEKALFDSGRHIFMLDGDTMRHGLNADLGFSPEARRENIRRTAHVARLLNQAGVSAVCALISPLQTDRDLARSIIGSDEFFEIYVSTPLSVCESRDPHGLYKRARSGQIAEFTGVSAPYEAPTAPALSIDTAQVSVEKAVAQIVGLIGKRSS